MAELHSPSQAEDRFLNMIAKEEDETALRPCLKPAEEESKPSEELGGKRSPREPASIS